MAKRLLILGPSFRRNRSSRVLPAIQRYDGLFYRVARKYLKDVKDVDVVVMIDDLTLVDGATPLPYSEPEGKEWGKQTFSNEVVEKAKVKNLDFLERKLRDRKYLEIFISMGKQYAEALPDLSRFDAKVIFPSTGGPGPKAKALKEWLSKGSIK